MGHSLAQTYLSIRVIFFCSCIMTTDWGNIAPCCLFPRTKLKNIILNRIVRKPNFLKKCSYHIWGYQQAKSLSISFFPRRNRQFSLKQFRTRDLVATSAKDYDDQHILQAWSNSIQSDVGVQRGSLLADSDTNLVKREKGLGTVEKRGYFLSKHLHFVSLRRTHNVTSEHE